MHSPGSRWKFRECAVAYFGFCACIPLVRIGAELGRAKREFRITCMRMLRTPPFFPPKSGEKPYLEELSRFGLWRDFLNDNNCTSNMNYFIYTSHHFTAREDMNSIN